MKIVIHTKIVGQLKRLGEGVLSSEALTTDEILAKETGDALKDAILALKNFIDPITTEWIISFEE